MTHRSREDRQEVALANLEVRIKQGITWWTSLGLGYSEKTAQAKLELATEEAETLRSRIRSL